MLVNRRSSGRDYSFVELRSTGQPRAAFPTKSSVAACGILGSDGNGIEDADKANYADMALDAVSQR
jgi:hypothetical protein